MTKAENEMTTVKVGVIPLSAGRRKEEANKQATSAINPNKWPQISASHIRHIRVHYIT